jgi:hypothetical protein
MVAKIALIYLFYFLGTFIAHYSRVSSKRFTFTLLFNFDGGGNRSARRKPPVRDPRRKFFLYDATYLVPLPLHKFNIFTSWGVDQRNVIINLKECVC